MRPTCEFKMGRLEEGNQNRELEEVGHTMEILRNRARVEVASPSAVGDYEARW